MKKILYLPLDERPCNYAFPLQVAKDNGQIELIAPDKNILGKKKIPANYEGVKNFLLDNIKDADGIIVSMDMLLYGGIVPSRLHYLEVDEILDRLNLLDKLKKLNPKIKIYASVLVMRCPTYTSCDEEPDYYNICGEEIHKTGVIEHKHRLGLISDEEYQKEIAPLNKITGANLKDYVDRRAKNVQGVIGVLKKTKTVVDYLVIPQDDSAPYGYTAMDQQVLHKFMDDNDISVKIYPGADEVGLTLLSKMVCDLQNVHPSIFVSYPEENNKNIIPLYEDRAIYKTMNSQITSAGLIETTDYKSADMVLFYNVAREQIEITEYKEEYFDYYKETNYLEKIDKAFADGKKVIIADKRYANGGDLSLMRYISSKHNLLDIAGYAGWNTSSNTLGTAICMANIYYNFGKTVTHEKFMIERLIEDIGYCCFTRWKMSRIELPKVGGSYHDVSNILPLAEKMTKDDLTNFFNENFPTLAKDFYISKCYLPWKRMFEVGIEIDKK